MVRVSGLIEVAQLPIPPVGPDGMTPMDALAAIKQRVGALTRVQQRCWHELTALLRDQGVSVLDVAELSPADLEFLPQALRRRSDRGAHADRGRSGAPVPVHPEQGHRRRPRARPRQGRDAVRPRAAAGQARALRPPARRQPALRAAGAADPHVLRLPVPGLRMQGRRLLPRAARQRHRARGGGRGPGAAVRDAAQAAAARQRDPAQHRCRHARAAALVPDQPHARGARGHRRGRRHPGLRRHRPGHRQGPAGAAVLARSRRVSRSGSRTSTAIASPRSAPRISSSTIPTRASRWWCSSCARRRATRR